MNQPLDALTLLRLLQLVDTSFPTGAYSFSNGLEGVAAFGLLASEAKVRELIDAQIDAGIAGIELPALFEAHRAADADKLAHLRELDELLSALKPIPAFRAASVKVGRRFLESALPLVASEATTGYHAMVQNGEANGHQAIAVAVIFQSAGIDVQTTALAFASSFLRGQIAAAVRLGLIGQTAAQRLGARLHQSLVTAVDNAKDLPIDEWGAYQPMLDLAGLRQPSLTGRLFAS
jgi:urease accessory protein